MSAATMVFDLGTAIARMQEYCDAHNASGSARTGDLFFADMLALLAAAKRYQWLRQHLQIGADGPKEWTCWLALACIPFRFDPSEQDAEKLLDALMERFPIPSGTQQQ